LIIDRFPQYERWTVKALKTYLTDQKMPCKGTKSELLKLIQLQETENTQENTKSLKNTKSPHKIHHSATEAIVETSSPPKAITPPVTKRSCDLV